MALLVAQRRGTNEKGVTQPLFVGPGERTRKVRSGRLQAQGKDGSLPAPKGLSLARV